MIHFVLVAAMITFSGQEASDEGPVAAVNEKCPIAKEAIDEKTFATYDGKMVGFCCPGCVRMFDTWTESRKSAFLEGSTVEQESVQPAPAGVAEVGSIEWTEPYSLDTCAVLGTKLGSMGDPVIQQHKGREVRFCCAGCVPRFEADPTSFLEKVDAQMIKDQRPIYPLESCLVTDLPLTEEGKDVGLDVILGNRLFRVRDTGARQRLLAEPKRFVGKLDEAVVASQRGSYPLKVCIVAGSELGSMGDPAELVVAGRLFRLCCAGCKPDVLKEPRSFIQKIDSARASKK